MRLLPRLVLAALFAALPAGLAVVSCGTGAVGVDECQSIEIARCKAAPSCSAGFDTARCEIFYRDECQVGIQGYDGGAKPSTAEANACVAAIDQAVTCIGAADSAACQALIPSTTYCAEVDAAATPCDVILSCPEVLAACAFVGSLDAGTSTTADADADAADDDAADAADE